MLRRRFCQSSVLALASTACAAQPGNSAMQKRAFSPTPDIAFAQACEVSNFSRLLFISGQVPEDENQRVPPDYPSQYRLAWANVEKQLKAAGMSFDNLIKATIFLSDRALIAQSNGLRREILGERTPAITIILAGIYDEAWLLEIEAVAAA
jgi:2-iminobutanoate/2-iminopropanoate deaminase